MANRQWQRVGRLGRRGTARRRRTAPASSASRRCAPSCRHAEARPHRLRDLVERVDLAVREGDVVEHRCALVAQARVGAAMRRRRAGSGASARRPRVRTRPGRIRRNASTTRGSSALPASCSISADRRFDGHRLVVRPVRRQRVEVVDEAENPRAERDVFSLEAGRIAAAVPALVVAEDERRDRIGKRHRAR